MMGNKILLPGTIIFFVLLNTAYYWEGLIGGWNMLLILIYLLAFLVFFISLIVQLWRIIRDRFKHKPVIFKTGIAAVLLVLIAWKPYGLVDFESLESKDLLVAFQKGTANCSTLLKLKQDNSFYIRSICFGIDKVGGTYTINHDTIRFNYSLSRPGYEYAVFKREEAGNKQFFFNLYLYRSQKDTLGYPLLIRKNLIFK